LSEEDLNLDDDKHVQPMVDVPSEVQELLRNYSEVFATKVSFPPPRPISHSIPLIPGARPVCIRPYRYSLTLKIEIEIQVKEMLDSGLIQHSSSPFSSPVLLVKQKENTFQFYVDYRHLNAITSKGNYPIPIIDELSGFGWFSTLDLCYGFHQIQMHLDDYFKTAFQTHEGHYEFKVMSFGLTRAPHSFQKAMNSVLAPLLRKSVLVFFDDILVYSRTYEQHLQEVLQLLLQDQWRIKLAKCSFA
jgi:hypothetical protein